MRLQVIACLVLVAFAVQDWDPLPDNAAPDHIVPNVTPDPNKGYGIIDYGNGVYFLTEGAYWSMCVVSPPPKKSTRGNRYLLNKDDDDGNSGSSSSSSGQTLLVIDAPTGFYQAGAFINAVKEVLNMSGASTVSDMLYSHQHTDHIGTASQVKQNWPKVQIHAHSHTCKRLRDRNDPRRPVPGNCYSGNFELSKFNIEASEFPAHVTGNLAIHHAPSQVLMLIDVVFPGWTPFRDLAIEEYTPNFLAAHDKILAMDWNILVPGHLSRLGNRQDVMTQKEYITDMFQYAADAMADTPQAPIADALGTFDPSSDGYLNFWALFEEWFRVCDSKCADRTLDKWRDRLGGADVFTYSHCAKIGESLRVD